MAAKLALDGGIPVRKTMLPYGRQSIDESDIDAVIKVLRSDWLTTGPAVEAFEEAFLRKVGSEYAVAVNSGTAALHSAMSALGIGPGDEVIVPGLTFAATANCVLYQGGTPVFADIEPDTLLVDPSDVERKISGKTKAIIAVDYAGQPCDYDALRTLAEKHDLAVVADACHALGATYKGQNVGTLADISAFSFHPVKHITTAEGGMVTTDMPEYAERTRWFRNHGISTDHRQRAEAGEWFYEMVDLGFNYRLPDLNCALGLSQLSKLDSWVERRRTIAKRYSEAFESMDAVTPIKVRLSNQPSWHLYPVLLDQSKPTVGRRQIYSALRAENIGVNVHYIPIYLHPYYRAHGYEEGLCPVAEEAYGRMITLPIFPAMMDGDVDQVIDAVRKVANHYLT